MAHTGFVYHPDYLKHQMGLHHPESPDRLRAILGRLEGSGLMSQLVRLEPTPPDPEWIASWITKVHTSTYVRELRKVSPQEGQVALDPDTSISPGSLNAACLAVAGALGAADAIMQGRVQNAFCAVRPPGHHADSPHAMGFCLCHNLAIPARYVQEHDGLER